MQTRYTLSRSGSIIERFAVDNNEWLTFLALHFAFKLHKEAKNGNINIITEVCCKLIKSGVNADDFLASVLLFHIVENTKTTQKEIREVFGYKLADEVLKISKDFKDIKEFEKHCLAVVEKAKRDNPDYSIALIEERSALNRDGIFLERCALEERAWSGLVALHYANSHLSGLIRDDGTDEIDHSTRVACNLIDRGIKDWNKISLALVHDVAENSKKYNKLYSKDRDKIIEHILKEVRVILGYRIAFGLDRITKRPGMPLVEYYHRILESEDAAVVKPVDKEHIFSTMLAIFKIPRIEEQIKEYQEHISPMMKSAREKYPDFKGLFFSCRNHINAMMLGIEKYISVAKFTASFLSLMESSADVPGDVLTSTLAEKRSKFLKLTNEIKNA